MNLHMDMIKHLHLRASKQYDYIYTLATNFEQRRGTLTEMRPFIPSLARKAEQAKKIANGLLDSAYSITPPTYEVFERYKNTVRFNVAFYQLWNELIFARHDMLCAPKNGLKYPFFLSSFDDNHFREKEREAMNNPAIVDTEIKIFRDRLHEGFLTYGIDNMQKCEERMKVIRALPYPI